MISKNLVESQAESQGIGHPLMLIFLSASPVDVPHSAARCW